jgi:hypothetical protein
LCQLHETNAGHAVFWQRPRKIVAVAVRQWGSGSGGLSRSVFGVLRESLHRTWLL